MAVNFCMNCGKKLEEGATRCEACGEAVPVLAKSVEETDLSGILDIDEPEDVAGAIESTDAAPEPNAATTESTAATPEATDATPEPTPAPAPEPEEDFSSFADFTGFDVMASDPGAAPAERIIAPPDRTDVMAPIGGMRNAHEYRAPQAEKNYLGKAVKIAIGIAALILAIAGVGLLTQPDTQNNIQQQLEAANSALNASSSEVSDAAISSDAQAQAEAQAQTEAEAQASSSAASSLSISDSAANLDEDTVFEYLTRTYDSLQSYNERVYSCLQTYNGVFVSPDKAQREAAAGIAKSLLAEMETEIKTLDSMNLGRASALYDDYEKVRRLLDDQYQRLAVVVESYDISLSYDNPYEHQTEILEPLTRDIGPSGQNSYLEDFDANYWSSRPVR